MSCFQDILDQLTLRETPARTLFGAAARAFAGDVADMVGGRNHASIGATPDLVAARYADHLSSPERAPGARQPRDDCKQSQNWEHRLAEAERKRLSVDELNALRRLIAWECHPDRGATDNSRRMARINGRIDALIARARRSG